MKYWLQATAMILGPLAYIGIVLGAMYINPVLGFALIVVPLVSFFIWFQQEQLKWVAYRTQRLAEWHDRNRRVALAMEADMLESKVDKFEELSATEQWSHAIARNDEIAKVYALTRKQYSEDGQETK